jgi:hypothetical protein
MRLINGSSWGAKSIAYAGALRTTHDRDLWFGGVAQQARTPDTLGGTGFC